MTVSHIMTLDPLTLTSTTTLAAAKAVMIDKNIRHIPVVDDHVLVGLVTQRDLLKAEQSSLLALENDQRDEHDNNTLLADFMKTKLVTIEQNTPLREAALYLQKHKIGCLPVVEQKMAKGVAQDKVIGIITDSDFVNVAINLLELAVEEDLNITPEL